MNFAVTPKRTRLRENVRAVLSDDECLYRASLPVRTVKLVYSNLLLPLRTIPLAGGIIERLASMRFSSRGTGVVRGCHPHPPPSGNWSTVTFGGLS